MNTQESQKQILKSTGIVGGAQVINIIIGIVKTKIIAILLGPAGIGIVGILQATIDLVRNCTGMGIHFSAVKEIAEAANSEDIDKISAARLTIMRWSYFTGILGMLIMVMLCVPISRYSFGSEDYALSIACVSIVLLLTSISNAQLSILQGLRKIVSMSKATLFGAIASLLITIPLFLWLEIRGIEIVLILTAISSLGVSYFYSRYSEMRPVHQSYSDTYKNGLSMVRLGSSIVIPSLMVSGTMYVVRGFLVQNYSIQSAGMFQAAWSISSIYMGIILNSMLADFFPRLSQVSENNKQVVKLTNEQSEIVYLIGAPLIIVIMAGVPIIVRALYSEAFIGAVPVLQWLMASSFVTLFIWPFSVIFLAKGKGIYAILTDGVWCLVYLITMYMGWAHYSLEVLGIASLIAGIVKGLLVFGIARSLTSYSFSKSNLRFVVFFGICTCLALCNALLMTGPVSYFIGLTIFILSCIFSYQSLKKVVDFRMIRIAIINRFVKR